MTEKGNTDKRRFGGPWGRRLLRGLLILFSAGGLVLFGRSLQTPLDEPASALEPTLQALTTELAQARSNQELVIPVPAVKPTGADLRAVSLPASDQIIVFTDFNEGYQHIHMTVPGALTSVALTTGSFDNADPALSQDGRFLAFRSNRDGNWDLYTLNLATGMTKRLTDTPGYEGAPTWSPDGRWLAYEAYRDGNMDIWIQSLEPDRAPIQLTNHAGLDAAPSWDPAGGRLIAFISNRAGSADVILANLDLPENRFKNLTNSSEWDEGEPVFSPAGTQIAYSTKAQGLDLVWTIDIDAGAELPKQIGAGSQPTWGPDGGAIAVVQADAHDQRVVVYGVNGSAPGIGLVQRGPLLQYSWKAGSSTAVVAVESDPQPLAPLPTELPDTGLGRRSLLDLDSVQSIDAKLIERAREPFEQLRTGIATRVGWDFLGSLEAAYVGLNDPLPPGFAHNDWLYTGRAFSFESSALEAGWVEVVPEEFGGKLYWRVFVRTASQDGSQGTPLRQRTWDFSVRYSGNPSDYDSGGAYKEQIPEGYYVDFTGLAEAFGFERQPALINWHTFYPGARFNEFAFTEGLDWRSAMLELYPPEAIATPTAFTSPTPTPTNTPWPSPTPWWLRWRTPTPTPSNTPIPVSPTITVSP